VEGRSHKRFQSVDRLIQSKSAKYFCRPLNPYPSKIEFWLALECSEERLHEGLGEQGNEVCCWVGGVKYRTLLHQRTQNSTERNSFEWNWGISRPLEKLLWPVRWPNGASNGQQISVRVCFPWKCDYDAKVFCVDAIEQVGPAKNDRASATASEEISLKYRRGSINIPTSKVSESETNFWIWLIKQMRVRASESMPFWKRYWKKFLPIN